MTNQIIRIRNEDKVIKATQDILLEYGICGATIDRIAEKSGLSTRSIYRNFNNRDELLYRYTDELIEMYFGESREVFDKISKANQTGLEQFRTFLTLYKDIFKKNYKLIILLGELETYFYKKKSTTNYFKLYTDKVRSLRSYGTEIICIGVKDGSIRKDLNIKLSCEMIETLFVSLMRKIALIYKDDNFKEISKPSDQFQEFINMVIGYLK